MRTDSDALTVSPLLAAARRRMPRHQRSGRVQKNNYLAEKSVSPGSGKRKQKRPGAPLLNKNAQTHGGYTAEQRMFRRYAHVLCLQARALIAARKAALAELRP